VTSSLALLLLLPPHIPPKSDLSKKGSNFFPLLLFVVLVSAGQLCSSTFGEE
jgi:hypothetical protein